MCQVDKTENIEKTAASTERHLQTLRSVLHARGQDRRRHWCERSFATEQRASNYFSPSRLYRWAGEDSLRESRWKR